MNRDVRLFARRNKHPVGRNQIRVGDLGRHSHSLHSGALLWLGKKLELILVLQPLAQIIEIGRRLPKFWPSG